MATLTNTKIKDTYQSLLKTTNNTPISGTNQYLTDGFGNATPLSVGTSNIGIGTTSPAYKLDVNGTGRFTGNLLATSNVGIGTTSPGAKLQINNASTVGSTSSNLSGLNPILYLDAGNAAGRSIVIKNHSTGNNTVAGALRFAVSPNATNFSHASIEAKQDSNGAVDTLEFRTSNGNTQGTTNNLAMIIQGSDVGIGTTSPSYKLEVNGTFSSNAIWTTSSSVTEWGSGTTAYGTLSWDTGCAKVFANSGNQLQLAAGGPGTDMTIDTNGNVGIGTTAPAYKLDVSGTGRFTSSVTASNYITSSDIRLKSNIQDISENNSIPVNWKTFEMDSEPNQKRYGVIAQELEVTNPEFVITGEDGYKSVAYTDLLIAKIAELETRIKQLENI